MPFKYRRTNPEPTPKPPPLWGFYTPDLPSPIPPQDRYRTPRGSPFAPELTRAIHTSRSLVRSSCLTCSFCGNHSKGSWRCFPLSLCLLTSPGASRCGPAGVSMKNFFLCDCHCYVCTSHMPDGDKSWVPLQPGASVLTCPRVGFLVLEVG